MSLPLSLHAIAYAQSPTLGGAIALMAKHRNDLASAIHSQANATMPLANEGAAEDRALREMAGALPAHAINKLA